MRRLAPWAWVVVLGTALAISWWSLDALALHFGVPKLLAAMVSATFDGAALVAADLALRRVAVADPAFAVKLLMVTTVGLSAWLNYEHGVLLGYPLVGRVLFAAPSVISGWLFELQLRSLRGARAHELGRAAAPLPQFGFVVWMFHPWAVLKRLSQIAGSRLHSVPVTVMDWDGAPVAAHELAAVPGEVIGESVLLAAPVDLEDGEAGGDQTNQREGECGQEDAEELLRTAAKSERSRVPDELYMVKLLEVVNGAGGVVPSAREVARKLGVGQDRARRLVAALKDEQANDADLGTTG